MAALQQEMGKMAMKKAQQQVQQQVGSALGDGIARGLQQVGIADPLEKEFQGGGLTVKQTMKGCFRECFGCEDTSEYRIGDYMGVDVPTSGAVPFKMYALEESEGWIRCCLCNFLGLTSARKLTLTVSQFNHDDKEDPERGRGGTQLIKFTKPWSCPVCIRLPLHDFGYLPLPCCFCMPELHGETVGALPRKLGHSKYFCDMFPCVPKWKVYNKDGQATYLVRPETCCFNCCIKCKCDGKKGGCLYEEMVLRDLTTLSPVFPTGKDRPSSVAKVWGGMKKECCSEADNFAVLYPDCDTAMKANLLGLTFLIDFTFYEGNAS